MPPREPRDVPSEIAGKLLTGFVFLLFGVAIVGGAVSSYINNTYRIVAPVEFDTVTPHHGMKGSLTSLHASATLSPFEWDRLVETMNDPAAWQPAGTTMADFTVTASPNSAALAWHDGTWASIGLTGEPIVLDGRGGPSGIVALRWLHESPKSQSPWKSMCFVVLETDGHQRLEPCNAYLDRPRDLQLSVQFHLDRDNRTITAAVRRR